jgi:hypothetical protein
MKKLLSLLMLSVVFAISANAQTNFAGKYIFYEDGGKTAGGTGIGVGHDLEINSDGTATLTANGFQTSKYLICKAKIDGSKMQLFFEKYGEENYGPTDLSGGELLLTLELKTVKKKKVLWTTFSKYEPSVVSFKKSGGVFFKKSKG